MSVSCLALESKIVPPGELPAGAKPIPGCDYGDGDDDAADDDDDPHQLDLQTKFISVSQHSAVVAQVPFELLPSSGCSFLLWKVDDLKTTRVRLG